MASLPAALDPVALEPTAQPVGGDVRSCVPSTEQPALTRELLHTLIAERERDRPQRLRQRDLAAAEPQRRHAALINTDRHGL
ncbi:MAG TPA: hypothetical protein VGF91_12920 [Solirubrobacteraceae bacterium]